MKNLLKLLFVSTLFFSITSCGSDSESESEKTELEGTWTAVEFSADVESNTTGDGFSSSSNIAVVGTSLDYDLNFDGSKFTTEGAYSYSVTQEISGQQPVISNESVSDVNGTGTYSIDGQTMTIDGSFYTLEYNGLQLATGNGEQMVDYEINSEGQLVFDQDETTSSEAGDFVTTTTTVSRSVWEKK